LEARDRKRNASLWSARQLDVSPHSHVKPSANSAGCL
jgi:hypothetical protein